MATKRKSPGTVRSLARDYEQILDPARAPPGLTAADIERSRSDPGRYGPIYGPKAPAAAPARPAGAKKRPARPADRPAPKARPTGGRKPNPTQPWYRDNPMGTPPLMNPTDDPNSLTPAFSAAVPPGPPLTGNPAGLPQEQGYEARQNAAIPMDPAGRSAAGALLSQIFGGGIATGGCPPPVGAAPSGLPVEPPLPATPPQLPTLAGGGAGPMQLPGELGLLDPNAWRLMSER